MSVSSALDSHPSEITVTVKFNDVDGTHLNTFYYKRTTVTPPTSSFSFSTSGVTFTLTPIGNLSLTPQKYFNNSALKPRYVVDTASGSNSETEEWETCSEASLPFDYDMHKESACTTPSESTDKKESIEMEKYENSDSEETLTGISRTGEGSIVNMAGGNTTQELHYENGKKDFDLSNDLDREKDESAQCEGEELLQEIEVEQGLRSFLDVPNPSIDTITRFWLLRYSYYQDYKKLRRYYVVTKGTCTGIFTSGVLTSEYVMFVPKGFRKSIEGLDEAIIYYLSSYREIIPSRHTLSHTKLTTRDETDLSVNAVQKRMEDQIQGLADKDQIDRYYVVAIGRRPGIYVDCETYRAQVDEVSGAVGKSFNLRSQAIQWYNQLLHKGKVMIRS